MNGVGIVIPTYLHITTHYLQLQEGSRCVGTPETPRQADPLLPNWNPVAGTQPAYGPNPGVFEYRDRVVGDTAKDPALSCHGLSPTSP